MPATAVKSRKSPLKSEISEASVRVLPTAAAPKKPVKKSLRATDVLAYLQKNPRFFTENADKLAPLAKPVKKTGGNLLSLHAFQADKTEQKAKKLATRQQQLISIAQANARIAETVFAAVLHLMQINSLGQLRTWLQTGFLQQLELNATRLYLAAETSTANTLTVNDIDALCPQTSSGGITLRTLTNAAERDLYGPKGKLVTSDALLRLTHPQTGATVGLLALGSTDATRFNAGQSTEFATFLGQALSIRLAALLATANHA